MHFYISNRLVWFTQHTFFKGYCSTYWICWFERPAVLLRMRVSTRAIVTSSINTGLGELYFRASPAVLCRTFYSARSSLVLVVCIILDWITCFLITEGRVAIRGFDLFPCVILSRIFFCICDCSPQQANANSMLALAALVLHVSTCFSSCTITPAVRTVHKHLLFNLSVCTYYIVYWLARVRLSSQL